jgi:hypothetical protein
VQSPAPPRPPGLVDGLIGAGTNVTSRLPGGVGTLTTQLLTSVAKTLDGVLPPVQSMLSAALGPKGLLSGLHLRVP